MTVSKPSKAYQVALAESIRHHESSKTYSGSLARPHAPALRQIVTKLGCRSVLDYGAGKGRQWEWVDPATGMTLEQEWGFQVDKYDPAWPPFATEPTGSYDLVICTHTLGAIPAQDLDWVLDRIYGLANLGVYFAEQIAAVKKLVHEETANRSIVDWIDLIFPHRREGVETVLALKYRHEHGSISGAFVF